MHLWNDIEGQTVAGLFPLERLLRTEGRSAFFRTREGEGAPAVIRLTEALNDQQQMFARYRAIKATGHAHLVEIKAFGETECEGAPLIYLVLEATEESLGDILEERALTLEETHEVANSVVGAVEALHANGLVHGLVEPSSVLAAGQVIKLRSDCARQAPEGEEGTRARAEDALGIAEVLHRSLTRQRLYGASDALALPEPYASIVRNCWRGSWGVSEVAAELRRVRRMAVPVAAAVVPDPVPIVYAPEAAPLEAMGAAHAPLAAPVEARVEALGGARGDEARAEADLERPREMAGGGRAGSMPSHAVPARVAEPLAVPLAGAAAGGAAVELPLGRRAVPVQEREGAVETDGMRPLSSRAGVQGNGNGSRRGRAAAPAPAPDEDEAQLPLIYAAGDEGDTLHRWRKPEVEESRPLAWVAGVVGVLLLALLVWYFAGAARRRTPAATTAPAGQQAGATGPAATSVPSPQSGPQTGPQTGPVTKPAPALRVPAAPYKTAPPSARAAAAPRTAAARRTVNGDAWRVIAYTYTQQSQAQAKARFLAQRHAGLHPQVWARGPRGPYLVTLGGAMSRQQAEAVRQKARGQGLARDVYIQNYSR